jgi:L-lysine exporter family protein LysE/ArgO
VYETLTPQAFTQGWLMTLGLIVAIGAQNALVLRQGLCRQHVGPVVALCTASDWLLTALGVFGLGAVIRSAPVLLEVFRYGGALFLIGYGVLALHRCVTASGMLTAAAGGTGLTAALTSTLALTYLNPHVYLDTVVLLGGVGAQHPLAGQVAFVMGAGLASLMWFTGLGYGAAAASRWLRHPAVWRVIDGSVAVVMFAVAAHLLLGQR